MSTLTSSSPETSTQPRVLVIDDDAVILVSCRRILEGSGYFVDTESDGLRGRERALQGGYDLVLVDMKMPDADGVDIVAAVRERRSDLELIVITGFASVDTAVAAVKRGAFDYVPKPFTPEELRSRAAAAIDELRRRKEALQPARRPRAPGMIGDSQSMAEVYGLVSRVAPTDATVLIVGESGTGKELLAGEIQGASRRRDKPMVSLDCSTLSPGLLESELFGHVKGSFTGAIAAKPGLFEVADKGTLFLDEVAGLSLETQGKLLRTLESGEIKPVGGVATRKVDIRLIAATSRDLEAMAGEGTFRRDLFYRLNVVPIHLPALRERRGDIPQLLQHFLGRFTNATARGPRRVSPPALARLTEYTWPGNVRELRNLVERLVVTVSDDTIREEHLPTHIVGRDTVPLPAVPRTNEELKAAKRSLHERLTGEVERAFVLDALRRNHWNVSHAARETGMLRPNFHALMRKHGVQSEDV